MDLDTFFVSCERLIDSRLEGRPILIGGTGDRGVVASCSYEARAFGVHSAMPMKVARQLCPEAIIIKGNSATYTKHSKIVTDIIRDTVPTFEKASVDEFYLDLTGTDKFIGTRLLAKELRQRIIHESGLPISFGLSANKTVSKVATGEAKPNNELYINNGNEKSFLAPLPVKKIPMVGAKTASLLKQMGVAKIATLQEMPVHIIQQALGKNGISLWKKANGIDKTPVIPYQERKSISTERTFHKDTTDVQKLKSILIAMTENLAYQLRKGEKVSACVTVKVRYSDFQTQSMQKKIPYTASDHQLIPIVLDLFKKLYSRRVLVRLIGVRFSHLVHGNTQITLFNDDHKILDLYSAMDDLRNKFGDRSIVRASGLEAKSIGKTNPFSGEPPILLPNRSQ